MINGIETIQNKKIQTWDMLLPIVLLSYFMLLLDNSIVFTGVGRIASDLHLSRAELSWVTNAYALSFGGFLLCGGKLGDIIGRKQSFIIGLAIFGISSFFVGASDSALSIILSRGVQGLGSSILAPTSLALLMENYTGEARVKAISAYAATAGLGATIGLLLGGFLTGVFSWRDGFYINVPISMILLTLSWKTLTAKKTTFTGSIDYLGAILSVTGMVSLVYSLVGDVYTKESLYLAMTSLFFFVFWEKVSSSPMMPLRLFADKCRFGAYFSRFFYMASMLSLWFLTPLILQETLGFNPFESGMAFFPYTIPNFYFAMKVPQWTKKYGGGRILVTGLALSTIGIAGISFFNPNNGYWLGVAIPFLLMGSGQGLLFSPLTSAGVANTLQEDAGVASGIVNVMHQIGGSVGLSIIISLTRDVEGTVPTYTAEMNIALVFIILAFLFALFFVYPSMQKDHAQ